MLGKYAAFIVPAYALTFAVLIGLVVWLRLQHRARRRDLAELEQAGTRRRSAATSGSER